MTYARPGEAERVSILKESERVPATLTQLDEMFPGLRENFEGGTSKCWMEDQWARGAWSFVSSREFDRNDIRGGEPHPLCRRAPFAVVLLDAGSTVVWTPCRKRDRRSGLVGKFSGWEGDPVPAQF